MMPSLKMGKMGIINNPPSSAGGNPPVSPITLVQVTASPRTLLEGEICIVASTLRSTPAPGHTLIAGWNFAHVSYITGAGNNPSGGSGSGIARYSYWTGVDLADPIGGLSQNQGTALSISSGFATFEVADGTSADLRYGFIDRNVVVNLSPSAAQIHPSSQNTFGSLRASYNTGQTVGSGAFVSNVTGAYATLAVNFELRNG